MGPVGLADRHGAVEAHDRAVGERDEFVVPLDDLGPVGLVRGLRVGVQGRDRRLRLEFAQAVPRQAGLQHGDALDDEVAPPQPTVLLGQRYEAAVGTRACRPARMVQQEQREQARDLRIVGRREQLPGQPDRLRGKVDIAAVALVEHQVQHP